MAPFKNGAFAMALEKQVPILPVSLLGAYKIMKGSFINWSPCEVVCHKPIYTDGFTTKDIDKFRDKCYKILQSNLIKLITNKVLFDILIHLKKLTLK